MGRRVKNRDLVRRGALALRIPRVTTAQRPTGKIGQILYNKTTNTFQTFSGAAWYNWSTAANEKTLTVDRFQGDGTTTVFGSGAGNTLDGSTAASFSVTVTDVTDIIVFVGGVYQVPTTNYTISGNQITFGSAPPANDGATSGHVITVIHNLHKLGE